MATGIDQICSACVMDRSTKHISFDNNGVCNFCRNYKTLADKFINIPEAEKRKEYRFIIDKIKRTGKNNTYDCVLGLSGGVDSSYLAYLAKQEGLRPLVIHFDNGWNSELAVKNIETMVSKLGFDLNSYVIDWNEFRELQRAYIKAGVVDIEVPTDYLITAVLYKLAAKNGIKFILSGYNYVTEYGLPTDWAYTNKTDDNNLRNIYKTFGTKNLNVFPRFSMWNRFYYQEILGIESIELLNKINYVKADVKETLKNQLGWRDYGGKHYESVFTRFYQGYILPRKFNIDKRKAHLSSLIRSKQLTRDEALAELKNPTYEEALQKDDYEFVTKKLGFTKTEFEEILNAKPIDHHVYGRENKNDLWFKTIKALFALPAAFLKKYRFIKATGKWRISPV
jgi:N-acetyl sugar amidotransferase